MKWFLPAFEFIIKGGRNNNEPTSRRYVYLRRCFVNEFYQFYFGIKRNDKNKEAPTPLPQCGTMQWYEYYCWQHIKRSHTLSLILHCLGSATHNMAYVVVHISVQCIYIEMYKYKYMYISFAVNCINRWCKSVRGIMYIVHAFIYIYIHHWNWATHSHGYFRRGCRRCCFRNRDSFFHLYNFPVLIFNELWICECMQQRDAVRWNCEIVTLWIVKLWGEWTTWNIQHNAKLQTAKSKNSKHKKETRSRIYTRHKYLFSYSSLLFSSLCFSLFFFSFFPLLLRFQFCDVEFTIYIYIYVRVLLSRCYFHWVSEWVSFEE